MLKKNKTISLSFTLDLVVYPFDIHFSFGETDEQLRKELSKWELNEQDIALCMFPSILTRARCVMLENGAGLIRLRLMPQGVEELSSLQHEITHYVMFLLNDRLSMPHNMDTTEAYCYLTAYITQEVYKRLPLFK